LYSTLTPARGELDYVSEDKARENRKDNSRHISNGHGGLSGSHSSNQQFMEHIRTPNMRHSVRSTTGQHKGNSSRGIEQWRYDYAKRIVPISAILTGIVLLIIYVMAWYELVTR
jgi:hypothetical protein